MIGGKLSGKRGRRVVDSVVLARSVAVARALVVTGGSVRAKKAHEGAPWYRGAMDDRPGRWWSKNGPVVRRGFPWEGGGRFWRRTEYVKWNGEPPGGQGSGGPCGR